MLLVDREAALQHDAGVAEAAFLAACGRRRTQASLPRRTPQSSIEGELEAERDAVAASCRRRRLCSSRPRSRASPAPTGRPGSRRSAGTAWWSAPRRPPAPGRRGREGAAGPGPKRRMPDPSGTGPAGRWLGSGGSPSRRLLRRPAGGRHATSGALARRALSRSALRRSALRLCSVAGLVPAVGVLAAALPPQPFLAVAGFARIQALPQQLGQVDHVAGRRGHLIGLDRRDLLGFAGLDPLRRQGVDRGGELVLERVRASTARSCRR